MTDLRLLQGGNDPSDPDAVEIRLIGVTEGTLAEVHQMLVELSRSGRIQGFEMERRAGPHDDRTA